MADVEKEWKLVVHYRIRDEFGELGRIKTRVHKTLGLTERRARLRLLVEYLEAGCKVAEIRPDF